jgi:lipopolysaccharide export system protein LptA
MNRPSRNFAALLGLLLAQPVLALQQDRSQPMDIRAERWEAVLAETGDARLTGGVEIVQGSLRAESATAVMTRVAGEVRRALLEGQPARLQQEMDEGGLMRATARSIDYDLSSEVVVLSGNVVVNQPRGELRGERITYDLKTGRLDAGGGEGGRIHMRIEPKLPSASP